MGHFRDGLNKNFETVKSRLPHDSCTYVLMPIIEDIHHSLMYCLAIWDFKKLAAVPKCLSLEAQPKLEQQQQRAKRVVVHKT